MRVRALLTVLVLLAASAGCDYVELVPADGDSRSSGSDGREADEYEPDPGGQLMTAMRLDRGYIHSLWPEGDVDFSYMDTSDAPGPYTLEFQVWSGPAVLHVWTRPSPTRGPSQLVYKRTLPENSIDRVVVETTVDNPCIAVRAEAAQGGYANYMTLLKQGSYPGEKSPIVIVPK